MYNSNLYPQPISYAGERTSKAVLNWVGTYHKKPFK